MDNEYEDYLISKIDKGDTYVVIEDNEDKACRHEKLSIVEKIELTPNSLIIRVDAKESGILAIFQNNYNGWSAKINDAPVKIERVNYIFQGIKIASAGTYTIELSYWLKTLTALIIFYIILIILYLYLKISKKEDFAK